MPMAPSDHGPNLRRRVTGLAPRSVCVGAQHTERVCVGAQRPRPEPAPVEGRASHTGLAPHARTHARAHTHAQCVCVSRRGCVCCARACARACEGARPAEPPPQRQRILPRAAAAAAAAAVRVKRRRRTHRSNLTDITRLVRFDSSNPAGQTRLVALSALLRRQQLLPVGFDHSVNPVGLDQFDLTRRI